MFNIRRPSPIPPNARPKLEARRNPLYSNQVVASTSTSVVFFREQVGSNSQTLLDTNMTMPSAIPSPRIFDVHAVILTTNQGLISRSAAPPATENDPQVPADFNNSLKGLVYSSHFVFEVGTKRYIEAPFFLLPGNQKYAGNITYALPGTTPFPSGRRDVFSSNVGLQWSTKMRRIRIQATQVFSATLTFPIAPVVAANGRVVYCYLVGIDYREVQ